MSGLILIINTGNTSTKIGIYKGEKKVFEESIKHSDEDLVNFSDINSQKEYREKLIYDFLKDKNYDINDFSAIAARGGLLKPLASGTYLVNDEMIKDLIEAKRGAHASHLSAQIGYSIANKSGINCYVIDPISVDELSHVARFSGHKLFERIMLSHALNMKAVAKRYAKENNIDYKKLNLIVVHLGTGISISVHTKGRMVDGINSSEEGCFSPDRSGGLPVLQVIRYIDKTNIEIKKLEKMIFGSGGLFSYLNTKNFFKVEEMYKNGDKETIEVVDAMAYQVAKEVGALATVVKGKIDKIIITGGMAYVDFLLKLIIERIDFLAPIKIYPGEDEIEALAEGTLRVLSGEEKALNY
jgi:butyrate kinase